MRRYVVTYHGMSRESGEAAVSRIDQHRFPVRHAAAI